jgi:hypothetical protein
VQTLALIDALVRRDDVATVGVALGGPVPPYAERTLHHRKVRRLLVLGRRLHPARRTTTSSTGRSSPTVRSTSSRGGGRATARC